MKKFTEVRELNKKDELKTSMIESLGELIDIIGEEELTDLYDAIINHPQFDPRAKMAKLKEMDQVDISDIYELLPEIDRDRINEVLNRNRDDYRVANLFAQKQTNGYGGITKFRIAKIVLDSLDKEEFYSEEFEERLFEECISIPEEAFAWEPRENWSIPYDEEFGIDGGYTYHPFIIIERSNNTVYFKTLNQETWEFEEVDKFRSKEKIDSFIKAIVEAREKVFGPKTETA